MGIGPNPHFILGKYSKIVICPKCKDVCILNIKNYKINLTGCKNGHNTRNIFLNEYKETQMINESKIICEDFKTNTKLNAYKNQFYKCFTCKKNLCLLCQKKNHNEHIIVDYEYKDYFCEIHGENYIYYCTLCNINLCDICEHDDKHKIINLKTLIKKEEILNANKKLKDTIDIFKKKDNEIIMNFNNIIKNLDLYLIITRFNI